MVAPEGVLGAVQARWVAHWVGPLPHETEATCGDCAMLGAPGEAPRGLQFLPDTKCCTFRPSLANFLLGGALASLGRDSVGARSLRRRIAEGRELSPLGLWVDPAVNLRATEAEHFGRLREARCPHFDDATRGCSLWAHRESTCATWYCKHTRGAVSLAYWNRLHQFLSRVERALALHLALRLGIAPEGLALLIPLDRAHAMARPDVALDGARGQLWGPWEGDPEGFFRACAAEAEAMHPDAVLDTAGSDARAMLAVLGAAGAQLGDDSLPARLGLGRVMVLSLGDEAVRVQGYSHLDPLDVPRALWELLPCFDGRPTEEAMAEARRRAGQEVPEGAVRMLVDGGILKGL